MSGFAWSPDGLGNVNGITIASWPSYWILSQIQNLGVPSFIIEAVFFWILFVAAGVSLYFLTQELFPKIEPKFAFLAVLFYWFNPVSLVNVWNRFLYNYMIFWALLPLALFFFVRGLKQKDYRFSILTSLSTVVFSYALTSTVFNILLWSLFFYTFLFFFLFERRIRLFYLKYFLLTLVSFVLFNFFWISQFFSFVSSPAFGTAISSFFTTTGNLSTLTSLSQRLGNLIDTLRLMHGSFFTEPAVSWAGIFSFPPLVILEFAIVGLIFLTIFRYRKLLPVLFLGVLFLSSLFLIKGNNPPFGELFQFAFVKIPFLQVFRNPFEKFGFLLPLAAAPLFAFGLGQLVESLKSEKVKTFVYFAAFLFIAFFWGLPFWTGLVFTRRDEADKAKLQSYEVKVPDYYKKADEWLKGQGENFRFIAFPLKGEGITYTWKKPYSGVELSSTLFETPNISFNTTIPYFDQITKSLEKLFLTHKDFDKIMNLLNARYIMARKDIDFVSREMSDPQKIVGVLKERSSVGKMEKVAEFGELSFWEDKDWKDRKIYVPQGIILTNTASNIEDYLIAGADKGYASYSPEKRLGEDEIKTEVIRPVLKVELGKGEIFNFEVRQDIFPYARFLPSSRFYPAILLKERLDLVLKNNLEDKANTQLALLGKRLVEIDFALKKKDTKNIELSLSFYRRLLKDFAKSAKELNDFYQKSFSRGWRQDFLYSTFSGHLIAFDNFSKSEFSNNEFAKNLTGAKDEIEEFMKGYGLKPYFKIPLKEFSLFRFKVEKEGEYDLVGNLALDDAVWFDGQKIGQTQSGFGKYFLKAGLHEIAVEKRVLPTIIKLGSEISFRAKDTPFEKRFLIPNFNSMGLYELEVEYWIKKGTGIEISLEEDNDKYKDGEREVAFARFLGSDGYYFDVRKDLFLFSPRDTARGGEIVFRVKPWNNCESLFEEKKCKNSEFKKNFNRETEVFLKKFDLREVFSPEISFKRDNPLFRKKESPTISYSKINPTEYKVKVLGAKEPYYLVFSELFNPSWQANFSDGSTAKEHFSINTYTNGWLIDKSGDYEMTLKFAPQELLDKGEKVSGISFLVGIAYLVGDMWRRRRE
jgi:hypothetical protein